MQKQTEKPEESKKPWLGEDGKPMTTDELRKACKTWRGDSWEEYLQWYEPLAKEDENEDLIGNIDALLQKSPNKQTYADLLHVKGRDSLKRFIARCMDEKLSQRQSKVIRNYYFQNLTLRQISRKLNLPPTTVYRLREEAHRILELACINAIKTGKKINPSP